MENFELMLIGLIVGSTTATVLLVLVLTPWLYKKIGKPD